MLIEVISLMCYMPMDFFIICLFVRRAFKQAIPHLQLEVVQSRGKIDCLIFLNVQMGPIATEDIPYAYRRHVDQSLEAIHLLSRSHLEPCHLWILQRPSREALSVD